MIALRDTNAYTAIMRGDDALLRALEDTQAILMASVVVGELEYGFRYGNRYTANRRQLDSFLSQPFVSFLTVTRDTTRHYGQIMSALRAAGTKIPTNDAWIAALARENDAGLWTHDAHFDHIESIDVHRW